MVICYGVELLRVVMVIKSCYGEDGGLASGGHSLVNGVWGGVMRVIHLLHDKGLIFLNSIKRVVGIGEPEKH